MQLFATWKFEKKCLGSADNLVTGLSCERWWKSKKNFPKKNPPDDFFDLKSQFFLLISHIFFECNGFSGSKCNCLQHENLRKNVWDRPITLLLDYHVNGDESHKNFSEKNPPDEFFDLKSQFFLLISHIFFECNGFSGSKCNCLQHENLRKNVWGRLITLLLDYHVNGDESQKKIFRKKTHQTIFLT